MNKPLRDKIAITIFLLFACRLGSYIPVPGIDGELALAYFQSKLGGSQNLFQLIDLFSGGSFSKMTVAALGVVPYISASIILQLLVALLPGLQRELKENAEYGRRKIARWTRLCTLALSLFQAGLYARYSLGMNYEFPGIVNEHLMSFQIFSIPMLFYFVVMITMATGTLVLMWVGEQISEHGIGNGISLIITANILASMPSTFTRLFSQLNLTSQSAGNLSISLLIVLLVLFVLIIMGTIQITQAQRKIPVQYSRRNVGFQRQSIAAGSSHLPLKLNYAGVIPVIFANSMLMFPATIGQFLGPDSFFGSAARVLSFDHWFGLSLYILLILFFSFFWTATQFQPAQIVSDMKKNGAFIPGIRQGKATQQFLEEVMSKITLFGSISLALISVLPMIITRFIGIDYSISQAFGGTSLLILVGVIMETYKQLQSHLMMRKYEGYMRRKSLRPKKA